MGHVTSSSRHTSEPDTITISQILRDFSQQETSPTTSVLKDFSNNLAGESSSDHNQLACVSSSD